MTIPPSLRKTAAPLTAGALLVTLLVLAFLWPVVTAKPRELPLAFVGTSETKQAMSDKIAAFSKDSNGDTPLAKLVDAQDEATAESMIRRREVYGAMVSTPTGLKVLTSTAASPAVAQLLQGLAGKAGGELMAQAGAKKAELAKEAATLGAKASAAGAVAETLAGLAAQNPALASRAQEAGIAAKSAGDEARLAAMKLDRPTPTVEVRDVVPAASGDPRGAGLGLVAFPLALGGIIGGALVSMFIGGRLRRVAGVVAYAVVAGLLITAVLGPWFKVLPGSFIAMWAGISMTLLATSAFIVGLHSVLGRPGVAVGGMTTMLLGNPLSAAAMPVEFYLRPWGTIGQFFVPGAGVTLVRDLAYFPAASTVGPWLVLTCWSVVGLALAGLVGRRQETVADDEIPVAAKA